MLANHEGVPTGEIAVPLGQNGDLFWKVLALDVHLIPASVVVRKDCFLRVGIFNRNLAGIDDWDMWTRIAEVRPILDLWFAAARLTDALTQAQVDALAERVRRSNNELQTAVDAAHP